MLLGLKCSYSPLLLASKILQRQIQNQGVTVKGEKNRDKSRDKNKKTLTAKSLLTPFFVGGPTWARTRDQLIMSQLL